MIPDVVWRRHDNGYADFRYTWSKVWHPGRPNLPEDITNEINEEEGNQINIVNTASRSLEAYTTVWFGIRASLTMDELERVLNSVRVTEGTLQYYRDLSIAAIDLINQR